MEFVDVFFTNDLSIGIVGTNFARFFDILSAALATGEHEKVAYGKGIIIHIIVSSIFMV